MNYSESFLNHTAYDYDITVDQVKHIARKCNEDGYDEDGNDFYDLLENYIDEQSQN